MRVQLYFLILGICLVFAKPSAYVNTRSAYNGTVGYDGLFKACATAGGIPCDNNNLLRGFWNSTSLATSWILSVSNGINGNCEGYSTDSKYVSGSCIMRDFKTSKLLPYVTMCSCSEYMSVCCYVAQ